ncbi:putative non-specific serine/threonine protein kinase [Helianthus anomalus]
MGGNFISSKIPPELGLLTSLQIALNLSHNNLTGSIPLQLGNLILLENLYLNNNKLTGLIPSPFANLSSLITCNFLYNNLTGPIPSVLLLQNMALTSFTGNNGLCGSPLPPCDGSSDSNLTPPSSNSRRIFTMAAVAAGDDDGGGGGRCFRVGFYPELVGLGLRMCRLGYRSLPFGQWVPRTKYPTILMLDVQKKRCHHSISHRLDDCIPQVHGGEVLVLVTKANFWITGQVKTVLALVRLSCFFLTTNKSITSTLKAPT